MRARPFVVAAIFATTWGSPGFLAAGPILRARAVVNGTDVRIIPADQAVVRRTVGAKGVAIAAAEVSNPFKGDYRVSTDPGGEAGNKAADDKQKKAIQEMVSFAIGLHELGPAFNKAATAKDKITGIQKVIYGGDAKFPHIKKDSATPLIARTEKLQNDQAKEFAQAEAKQTLTAINNSKESPLSYKSEEKITAEVAKGTAKKPIAVGFAFNDDPIAIEWEAVSSLRVELDQLSLEVETEGAPSSAVTLLWSDALFINGTLDLESDIRSAQSLYELLLFAYSIDGSPAVLGARLETFGNTVMDSLGNSGLIAVQAALQDRFRAVGPRIGFDPGYFFDVTIPGDPDESVLFLRDGAAATATVPEPSAAILGFLGLLAFTCRRYWVAGQGRVLCLRRTQRH